MSTEALQHRTVSNVKVPAQWARLMRRLMALQDGQHQIVLHVSNGTVETWSLLMPYKIEK